MAAVKFTAISLRAFLEHKNPIASQKAAATIIQSVQILEQHSQIGRPVEDMGVECRELRIGCQQGELREPG